MITLTKNRGFQLTFDNLTISVQIGIHNYCERRSTLPERRSTLPELDPELRSDTVKSNNAEIAIWDKEGNWFNFGNDEVKGWVETKEIAKWIDAISKSKDLDDLKILSTMF
jgi:hypothetical protein